jgi:hypothetical protein
MEDEINEATSETENLNMATVSQKEGYSRHSESEKGERHAKDVEKWWRPGVSFQNNVMSWYLE